MDIKAGYADRFLKALPKEIGAVLFYGADAGLVSERGERLAKALAGDARNPGEVLRITEQDLSENPERLAVELKTIPMFGGRNVVRVLAQGLSKPDLLEGLVDGEQLEAFLIVEAGNLKPDSKLRSLFASAKTAAAVACFGDDGATLGQLIDEVMRASGTVVAPEARDHLISLLGADRALSRNEIEKLALYAGKGARVAIEDVDAIIGDASEQAIDRIVMPAASGKAAVALRELDKAIAAGEPPQMILLALLRHLQKLSQVRAALDAGRPAEVAVGALRPPLHFKIKDEFMRQVRGWTAERLSRAETAAFEAQKAARLSNRLERAITERLVMDVAEAAGR
jgi:DNA polymerase-3 subunit delta